ncbi:MAG: pentapeptide repeat-containing protein, partial [Bacteroidota bacterium]|nr:pentapeptide repeat-containing protein [Bacteroidota bacterium]
MLNSKIIGNKIAEARKKINISQAQLAQRLSISSQAVGKWERGESMPDIITLNRLAEILGVDLNYFSENFQSADTEIAPVESFIKQPVELPSGNHKKKLNWDMSSGNWVDADFSGLKNLNDKFSSSNMQRCKFIGSDLSGLILKSNNVDSCDFSGSNICSSHIQRSNLGNNIFKDCKLKEAEFSESNINGCDFSGADFTGTEFSKSFISGCDFTGVDFNGAVFKSGGIQNNQSDNAVWNSTSFNDMWIVR